MQLLCGVLKTYPRMMSHREQLPPMIHHSQVSTHGTPLPLVNCFSLMRMWEGRLNGDEMIVEETIQREMTRLFHKVCCSRLLPLKPWNDAICDSAVLITTPISWQPCRHFSSIRLRSSLRHSKRTAAIS
jgi:hypothetical protein